MPNISSFFAPFSKLKYRSTPCKFWLVLLVLVLLFSYLRMIAEEAEQKYQSLLSVTLYDRNGVALRIKENTKGHYVIATKILPADFKNYLIQKEDQYFYYHPGINPFSTARAVYTYLTKGNAGGASTITQQLAKNLLGTELDRTLANKFREAVYAGSLEFFYTKEEILTMYTNTVYLGNQVQGFETASHAYFGKSLTDTTHNEQLALLATLSYPNARNPWKDTDFTFAESLHQRLTPEETFRNPQTTDTYSFQNDAYFELRTAGVQCTNTCYTTIDAAMTEKIRNLLERHIAANRERGVRNGAIVVLDPARSEIIALIGSKNPASQTEGNQINMALAPRPIGSTIKPLLYLKGFMDGLRPYSLVVDREYKYSIATGFPLYPKNYDGQYHGEVTLHEALSNSLNVPTVKTLEYIGLSNFYSFLSDTLHFRPLQSYDHYQYGIALGGLEMDLLTLTHYFTLFPRQGTIEPLQVVQGNPENFSLPPQSTITKETVVSDKKFTQLVHAIISDRLQGVNQFGLTSNLNIEAEGYGVKTGTSRDFHDSWVVGYTGDFVVGVWIGNTENEPLTQITGATGAGAIWHDTMNLLLESPYHKGTIVPHNALTQFPIKNSLEWGLPEDSIADHQTLLLEDILIESPHERDSYEFFSGITIPLTAATTVRWSINGTELGIGKELEFQPEAAGTYEISAVDTTTNRREIVIITVVTPQ
jgi:membrane peptidoglycan carboxypeptidase